MIHNVRTVEHKPEPFKYPIYLRDLHQRWFIKLLSDQQVVWLYIIDKEGWRSTESGKRVLPKHEFFDVPFLLSFLEKSTEVEYLVRLENLLAHYDKVREAINE